MTGSLYSNSIIRLLVFIICLVLRLDRSQNRQHKQKQNKKIHEYIFSALHAIFCIYICLWFWTLSGQRVTYKYLILESRKYSYTHPIIQIWYRSIFEIMVSLSFIPSPISWLDTMHSVPDSTLDDYELDNKAYGR